MCSMASKFEIGDRIKLSGPLHYKDHRDHKNDIGVVHDIANDGSIGVSWSDGELSALIDGPHTVKAIKVNEGGSMDSVINKLKELNLSPDEKLLQNYNIVDKQGNLTQEGKDLVANNSFNDQKTAIVTQLKALAKAEKDDAK